MAEELATTDIIEQKLDQAAGKLKELDIDAWITCVQETSSGAERIFSYISPGHLTWESAVVVTKEGKRYVILGEFDQQVFEASKLYDEVITFVQDFNEPFTKLLSRLAPGTIALNYSLEDPMADGVTHGRFLGLEALIKKTLPSARIVPAEKIITSLVSRKSPIERDHIQRAVDITVKIFDEITAFIRVGRSEKETYDFIQERFAERNLKPSFETLVFAGDRGVGMGHGTATGNDFRPGDLVHVDMGVFVEGYASDMQRTWYLLRDGEDTAPEEAIRGFNTIIEAIAESGKILKPGVTGVEVDAVARGIVTAAGFPEYPHGLGHQIGRNVHDGAAMLGPAWPRYKSTPMITIEADQIFTLEPSLTVPGYGAVGVEEDVIVTPGGAQYMAEPQRELIYIRR